MTTLLVTCEYCHTVFANVEDSEQHYGTSKACSIAVDREIEADVAAEEAEDLRTGLTPEQRFELLSKRQLIP